MRAAACSPHPALLSQPGKRREGGRSPKRNRASPSARRARPGRDRLHPATLAPTGHSVSRVHLLVCRVCTLHPSSYLGPPASQTPGPSASHRWRKSPCPLAPPAGEREGCGGRVGAGRRAGRGLRRREEVGSVPDGAAASEPGRSGEGAAGHEPGSAAAAPGFGTHVELPGGAREQ